LKLISRFDIAEEAEDASQFLESRGVATFVSSKRSHRLGRLFTGALHVGLWVLLDDQAWDAERLLRDPEHKVSNPLSQSALMELKAGVESKDHTYTLNVLFGVLGILLALALAMKIFGIA